MDTYLLDLQTNEPRPKVRINGQEYEMASTNDLNLSALALFRRIGAKWQRVETGDEDDAAIEEMAAELRKATSLVVPALPDELMDQLSDMQKLRLIEAFSSAVDLAGENPRQESPSGAGPSPDSSDSTAVPSTTG